MKEIVDMIKAEAEAFIKSISPPLDCILRDEDYSIVRQAIKSTYIAGRSKNIEREKELENKLKQANEFICDIAKLLGEDGLGLDDLKWSINDFEDAIKQKDERIKELEEWAILQQSGGRIKKPN